MRSSQFRIVILILILILASGCQVNPLPTSTPIATDTPPPTATYTPTEVEAAATSEAAQTSDKMHIYTSEGSLTIYTPKAISLNGFQFEVPVRDNSNVVTPVNDFFGLSQMDGLSTEGACYVYLVEGEQPEVPDVCQGQVYQENVAQGYAFWYDAATKTPLDLPIFQNNEYTGITCPAMNSVCEVDWQPDGSITPEVTPAEATVEPSMTSTPNPSPTVEVAVVPSAMPTIEPSPEASATPNGPTATPTISPTAAPTIDQTSTAQPYALTPTLAIVRMTNSTVNVRVLPDGTSEIVEALSAGTQVTTIGQQTTADGHVWYNVQLADGKTGWIKDDVLTYVGKPTASAIRSSDVLQAMVVNNNQWAPLVNEYEGVPMVLVPRGCFYVSSNQPNSLPMSFQCVQKPFWIDVTEVTNQQFSDFGGVAAQPSAGTDRQQPRDTVSWQEATDFCTKRNMRLPTELEWEFSASGPSNFLYPWGNDFVPQNLVFSPDVNKRLTTSSKVGSILNGMSWVGALDMSGNLFEWVSTDYDQKVYPELYAEDQSRVGNTNQAHVHHGGAYYNNETDYMRFSYRGFGSKADKYVGFRCVRDFQRTDLSS